MRVLATVGGLKTHNCGTMGGETKGDEEKELRKKDVSRFLNWQAEADVAEGILILSSSVTRMKVTFEKFTALGPLPVS